MMVEKLGAAPLRGRVAVVTGVSRRQGIGYAIALRLAAAGADLFITHRYATVKVKLGGNRAVRASLISVRLLSLHGVHRIVFARGDRKVWNLPRKHGWNMRDRLVRLNESGHLLRTGHVGTVRSGSPHRFHPDRRREGRARGHVVHERSRHCWRATIVPRCSG